MVQTGSRREHLGRLGRMLQVHEEGGHRDLTQLFQEAKIDLPEAP